MFAWVTITLATVGLIANLTFWLLALRGYLAWRKTARAPEPKHWPTTHVIVCLKGPLPRLSATVDALNGQDYRGDYRVTFVTEAPADAGDEAAQHLATCLDGIVRCDHIIAGRVVEQRARCAQKNFNLLAGIRHAESQAEPASLWAFCDGDLLVREDWLSEMIRPLATGSSEVSTSFHWVVPEGRRIIEALHGIAEFAQSVSSLVCRSAAWGGSLAIRPDVFRRLGLHERWENTVVDDMTLSQALRDGRVRVTPVPRFLVQTYSDIGGYSGFVRWLSRQYFFVKIYIPSLYRLLWTKGVIDLLVLWLAVFHGTWLAVTGDWIAGPLAGLIVLVTAAGQLATFYLFRYLIPERPAARAWGPAALLAPGATFLACATATLRRRRLTWSDLTYEVGRDGSVAGVAPSTARRDDPEEDPDRPELTEEAA